MLHRRTKASANKQNIYLYHPLSSINKCKKPSKEAMLFGMKIIVNQFGDGWHKYIMDQFVGQRIEALFGGGWHK